VAAVFDHIIVGAGSAGCVLAHRLSEDPGCRVLLLEAGPPDRSLFIHMPAAFVHAISRKGIDWGYTAEAEDHLGGHREPCPRGRVLGGSSSVNAMAFVRGHRSDYDDWAAGGLDRWSFAHCLPYFRRMEAFSGGADAWRGGQGPLHVTAPRFSNPLNGIFLEAAEQAGFPLSPDTNGERQEGVAVADQTIHGGRRVSTATAYLDPVRHRDNLVVRTGAQVAHVAIEQGRATGVVLLNGERIAAEAGVILSGGAINTPQLLMLSGIGPADHLRGHGIDVVADSPDVGGNLQDHVDVSVVNACVRPVSGNTHLAPWRRPFIGLQWLFAHAGPAATNHFEAAGYVRTRDDLERPNIQLFFIPLAVRPDSRPVGDGHGYQATVMLLRPRSRGRITLASADPTAAPLMRFNYLKEPSDAEELAEGVAAMRRVFASPAFDPYRGAELQPGSEVTDLADFVRRTMKSTHHPCGTCRMGMDDGAPVDAEGRVRGVEGLRVVDASVMPQITGGNINAPVIMLAEKLSDAILGRDPLPPERPWDDAMGQVSSNR